MAANKLGGDLGEIRLRVSEMRQINWPSLRAGQRSREGKGEVGPRAGQFRWPCHWLYHWLLLFSLCGKDGGQHLGNGTIASVSQGTADLPVLMNLENPLCLNACELDIFWATEAPRGRNETAL